MVTSCPISSGLFIIFVVIPLTTGKTVTARKDENAKPTTAFPRRHLLVTYDDIIFSIYLDAASLIGSVRHFGESLGPAGLTPQSGLVKILIFVSEFVIASQRQWCLSQYYFAIYLERLSAQYLLKYIRRVSFSKQDQPHRMFTSVIAFAVTLWLEYMLFFIAISLKAPMLQFNSPKVCNCTGILIGHIQYLCHYDHVCKFPTSKLSPLPYVDNLNRAVVGRSRLTTTVRGSLLFNNSKFLSTFVLVN